MSTGVERLKHIVDLCLERGIRLVVLESASGGGEEALCRFWRVCAGRSWQFPNPIRAKQSLCESSCLPQVLLGFSLKNASFIRAISTTTRKPSMISLIVLIRNSVMLSVNFSFRTFWHQSLWNLAWIHAFVQNELQTGYVCLALSIRNAERGWFTQNVGKSLTSKTTIHTYTPVSSLGHFSSMVDGDAHGRRVAKIYIWGHFHCVFGRGSHFQELQKCHWISVALGPSLDKDIGARSNHELVFCKASTLKRRVQGFHVVVSVAHDMNQNHSLETVHCPSWTNIAGMSVQLTRVSAQVVLRALFDAYETIAVLVPVPVNSFGEHLDSFIVCRMELAEQFAQADQCGNRNGK